VLFSVDSQVDSILSLLYILIVSRRLSTQRWLSFVTKRYAISWKCISHSFRLRKFSL